LAVQKELRDELAETGVTFSEKEVSNYGADNGKTSRNS
jgi:hypothetical protein